MNTEQIRDDAKKNPDVLQSEIDSTRANVGETLDALQARLSPGQFLDEGVALLKRYGGEFAGTLGTSIKRHPMPIILTGIGLTWLIVSARSGQSPSPSFSYGDYEEYEGEGREGLTSTLKAKAARVAEATGSVRDKVRGAASQSREQIQRARASFSELLQEQPLLLGLLGIGLGAAIGAALPSTQKENELLGETRDRALDRMKSVGSEQVEKVRQTVKQTMESATGTQSQSEGREQGSMENPSPARPY